MAFTLINFPKDVEPIKGRQAKVSFTTDKDLYEFSSKQLRLQISGSIQVDETITIQYGDISITFTGANPAGTNGYNLSTNAGSLPLDEYADLLAEELEANFDINRHFKITRESGSFEFIYIEPCDNFTNDFSQTNDFANISILSISSGTPAYEKNLKIVCMVELYDELAGTYGKPLIHIKEPAPKKITFNIAKDFDLQHDFPVASSIDSSFFFIDPCVKNWVRYRLKYAEHYGNPSQTRKLFTSTDDFFAYYGGRSYEKRLQNFWDTHKNNEDFLSL